MLTYEEFEKAIKIIQDHEKTAREFSEFLNSKICDDSFCYVSFGENLADMIITLLNKLINKGNEKDKYGEDWISWWLYEDAPKIIYFSNGLEKNVEDLHDFYDYLISE